MLAVIAWQMIWIRSANGKERRTMMTHETIARYLATAAAAGFVGD